MTAHPAHGTQHEYIRLHLQDLFRSARSDQLDSLIARGLPRLRAEGSVLRGKIPRNQVEVYTDEALQRQYQRNRQSAEQIQSQVRRVQNGDYVDGKVLQELAECYLAQLVCDFDLTLRATPTPWPSDLPVDPLQVSILAMAIATELGLSERSVREVGIGALVVDWGLLCLPPELRHPSNPRTRLQELEYRKHPVHALELLAHVHPLPAVVPLIVYQARERRDGTGYPRGYPEDRIHPLAKVLQIAHLFVAWTTPGQRPPLLRYAAAECLVRQAGMRMRDAEIVKALLRVLSLFPLGGLYELSDGRQCRSVRTNPRNYEKPIVQTLPTGENSEIIRLASSGSLTITKAVPEPGVEEVPLTPARMFLWE